MKEKDILNTILSKDNAHIYFVGIGGIAMSAAANLAKQMGFEVSGSDCKEVYSPAKDVLDQNKIKYSIGYQVGHVTDSKADLFVLSAGESPENPEVKYILDNNLPHIGFPELLYELTKDKLRVVVAGTHGKSTTAGLLGYLFKNLDNSSFMVGAVLQNYESNFYLGDGNYFVFEGDEYKSEFDDPTPKFQYYKPDILVLNNLEFDHPDVFENLEAMEREFEQLIAAMPEDGLIIYNADDANISKLVHESNVTSVSFGIDNEADFKTEEVKFEPDFTSIYVNNKFSKDTVAALIGKDEEYKIQLPGKINVYNALAAIAALRTLGFGRENIALDLLSYTGVKRRFEVIGVKNGITLIDDYAHHSTAVRETLEAAKLRYFSDGVGADIIRPLQSVGDQELKVKDQGSGKLWAIFEPHTFSRTKATLPDLAKAFDAADEVLISEIYPAREKMADATITSQQVISAVLDHNSKSQIHNSIRLIKNKEQALDIIKSEAKAGDVAVVMAVGSFNRLAYELKEKL